MIERMITKRPILKKLVKKAENETVYVSRDDFIHGFAVHIPRRGLASARVWTEQNFGPLLDAISRLYRSR